VVRRIGVTVQPSEGLFHWSTPFPKPSEGFLTRGTERLRIGSTSCIVDKKKKDQPRISRIDTNFYYRLREIRGKNLFGSGLPIIHIHHIRLGIAAGGPPPLPFTDLWMMHCTCLAYSASRPLCVTIKAEFETRDSPGTY
jgi:hypothetical protein